MLRLLRLLLSFRLCMKLLRATLQVCFKLPNLDLCLKKTISEFTNLILLFANDAICSSNNGSMALKFFSKASNFLCMRSLVVPIRTCDVAPVGGNPLLHRCEGICWSDLFLCASSCVPWGSQVQASVNRIGWVARCKFPGRSQRSNHAPGYHVEIAP